METRTLCKRCAENYREAGFILEENENLYIREPCDICSRRGREYFILDNQGGGKLEHCKILA